MVVPIRNIATTNAGIPSTTGYPVKPTTTSAALTDTQRNQSLLSVLNTKGRTTVKRDELLKKEFDFNYFTNLITTRYGRVYYFCYDQGYSPIDGRRYCSYTKR